MELTIKKEDCPCTNDCIRHGDCVACKEHHKKKTYKSACER